MKKISFFSIITVLLCTLFFVGCANANEDGFYLKYYCDNRLYDSYYSKPGNYLSFVDIQPVKNGYEFKGWYYDEEYNEKVVINTVFTSDTSVYAKFDIIQYNITYHLNEGICDEPLIYEYYINSNITLPTPIRLGYEFKGWYDSNSDEYYTIISEEVGDKELFAEWQIVGFDIYYENTFGVNNNNPLTYTVEDEVALFDITREGYIFEGWYDNGDFIGEKIKHINTHDCEIKNLYAKWTPINYNITYHLNRYATLPDDYTTKYNLDDIVELPIPIMQPNHVFTGWTYNSVVIYNTVGLFGNIDVYMDCCSDTTSPELYLTNSYNVAEDGKVTASGDVDVTDMSANEAVRTIGDMTSAVDSYYRLSAGDDGFVKVAVPAAYVVDNHDNIKDIKVTRAFYKKGNSGNTFTLVNETGEEETDTTKVAYYTFSKTCYGAGDYILRYNVEDKHNNQKTYIFNICIVNNQDDLKWLIPSIKMDKELPTSIKSGEKITITFNQPYITDKLNDNNIDIHTYYTYSNDELSLNNIADMFEKLDKTEIWVNEKQLYEIEIDSVPLYNYLYIITTAQNEYNKENTTYVFHVIDIYTEGDEYALEVPTNSYHVVPSEMKYTENRRVTFPVPSVLKNDSVINVLKANIELIIVKAGESPVTDAIYIAKDATGNNTGEAYFEYTFTSAGRYRYKYQYRIGSEVVATTESKSFWLNANSTVEDVELDYATLSSMPSAGGQVGTAIELPQVKVFQKGNSSKTYDAYTKVKVTYIGNEPVTSREIELEEDGFSFIPKYIGDYQVEYEISIPNNNLSVKKVKTYIIEDVTDTTST